MRTTGKGLYKWLKKQENVRWPHGGGFLCYLSYKGIDCAGLITKTYSGNKLIATSISIRPLQSIHDIGTGNGGAVIKSFCDDANKKPRLRCRSGR